MIKFVVVVRAVILAALFAPTIAFAQAVDQADDRAAADKLMHDYFEAYSRGDMSAVMSFISVPFVIQGPKGFTVLATSDEALGWYSRFRDAAVKQGYAKTEWIDLGGEASRSILCHRGRYIRSLQDRWK